MKLEPDQIFGLTISQKLFYYDFEVEKIDNVLFCLILLMNIKTLKNRSRGLYSVVCGNDLSCKERISHLAHLVREKGEAERHTIVS